MKHRVTVTVLKRACFADLQREYLADPESGPCPCFREGQVFEFRREGERDDFYRLGRGTLVAGPGAQDGEKPAAGGGDFPCGEAWDCISRYVYTALQGGSIMHRWTRDERLMVACCNDGTRPVAFRIERIDVPETDEETVWLAAQDFSNSAEDAITG